jgi:pilus assembly protein CpaE
MSPARDEQIRVFVAASTRLALERLTGALSRQSDIAIVGSATDSQRVLAEIPRSQPWVVVAEMGLQPQSAVDVTREIDRRFPGVRVIILAGEQELGLFKDAVRAGARDFIVQPVEPADLIKSIIAVGGGMPNPWQGGSEEAARTMGRLVAVVSGKGGTGKTLLSVNLAVALAQRFRDKVALVDLSAQSGDVDLWMNLRDKRSVSDLAAVMQHLTAKEMDAVLIPAQAGLRVLLAPSQPEDAEVLTLDNVAALLTYFKSTMPLTIVDTHSYMDDVLLVTMREADVVLMVATPDVPALRSCARLEHVMQRLKYPRDKVQLVLNRVSAQNALGPQQVMQNLGRPTFAALPEAPEMAQVMANEGKGYANWPKAPLSVAIEELAEKMIPLIGTYGLQGQVPQPAVAPSKSRR